MQILPPSYKGAEILIHWIKYQPTFRYLKQSQTAAVPTELYCL